MGEFGAFEAPGYVRALSRLLPMPLVPVTAPPEAWYPPPVPAFDYGLFATALAEANRAAFQDLRQECPGGSNFKCKELTPWDGKNDSWDSWLQDCNMAFELRSRDFTEDRVKVAFAGGFLKEGSAVRNWYLLANRMLECPPYLNNWVFFVEELWSRFLPRDCADRALEELTQLKMKPAERIAEFNNKFQL
jgi:hypothetical protein